MVGKSSGLFPEVNALPVADGELFVAKISGSGSALLFSSRFGGTGGGRAEAVAVDGAEYVYVGGETSAKDFPTTGGAFRASCTMAPAPNDECADAFAMKINMEGPFLVYSIYLGGTGRDWARDMTIDADGYLYLAGETESTDLPTLSAFQGSFAGGSDDCFVTKLSQSGGSLIYSTYLGSNDLGVGGAREGCYAIAVDSAGMRMSRVTPGLPASRCTTRY